MWCFERSREKKRQTGFEIIEESPKSSFAGISILIRSGHVNRFCDGVVVAPPGDGLSSELCVFSGPLYYHWLPFFLVVQGIEDSGCDLFSTILSIYFNEI